MSLAVAPSTFRIDTVPHGRGVIGVSACPGASTASLDDDLSAVRAFRPDAIVTLMSPQEMRLVGCADLPDVLPGVTTEWHHLALRAGGAPDARFERLWTYAGHRLRAVLRRGGKVLIHCDAGRLRAKWMAARLLVELGVPAADAATRTGAPRLAAGAWSETPRVMPAAGSAADDQFASRILGCLFGGALGDAFGYPIEFRSLKRIRETFGEAGLTEPVGGPQARLVVSDDTQLTLYTADGLLAALADTGPLAPGMVLARIRQSYLAWFRTQREEYTAGGTGVSQYRELWAARAPGSTCLSALRAGGRGTPDAPINDSKGSGGVMRVSPLALVAAIDADQAFRLAHAAAALTHGHADGRVSAAALAGLLRDLLGDMPMTAALARMETRLRRVPGSDGVLAAVRAARDLAGDGTASDAAIASLGQGWSGAEALAIGLYSALRADSFEGAIRLAANHDGDSDTTAAIAGQIWGALYGFETLPHAWISRLDVLEPLCDVAGRLIARATVGVSAPELRRVSA